MNRTSIYSWDTMVGCQIGQMLDQMRPNLIFSCRIFDTLGQKVQKFEKKLLLSIQRCRPSVAQAFNDGTVKIHVNNGGIGITVCDATPFDSEKVVQRRKVVGFQVFEDVSGDA